MNTSEFHIWKGAKGIGEVEFRNNDKLDFGEQSGYSITTELLFNDRFS